MSSLEFLETSGRLRPAKKHRQPLTEIERVTGIDSQEPLADVRGGTSGDGQEKDIFCGRPTRHAPDPNS